jgi:glycosyltransferase involved in cell wall biosynthesis
MPQASRILLLIPRLAAGGAEQVMTLIARSLPRNRYEVHLGLITQKDAAPTAMPPWVAVHPLGARRTRAAAYKLLRLIWRIRPAVVFTSSPEISFLVLLLRPLFSRHTRVLVRQNSTVSAVLSGGIVPWYTQLLYRLLYRRADHMICQTRAMAADLEKRAGLRPEQIAVLPNPVDLEAIRAARDKPCPWPGRGPHLLAVGRLSPEKGFDLLIAALATVRQSYPEADLLIAGDGREEQQLRALARSLSIETAVHLPGRVASPYTYFPSATLFVLSSRWEGMPNALIEAATAGLPLVATPASGGIVELLGRRANAWLAPAITAPALAATILTALDRLGGIKRDPADRAAIHDETVPVADD